jgi:hypothetical protein
VLASLTLIVLGIVFAVRRTLRKRTAARTLAASASP